MGQDRPETRLTFLEAVLTPDPPRESPFTDGRLVVGLGQADVLPLREPVTSFPQGLGLTDYAHVARALRFADTPRRFVFGFGHDGPGSSTYAPEIDYAIVPVVIADHITMEDVRHRLASFERFPVFSPLPREKTAPISQPWEPPARTSTLLPCAGDGEGSVVSCATT